MTVRAEDSGGLSVAQDFDVTVSTPGPTNQAPVLTQAIPAQTVRENESISVDLDGHFSDPEGGSLVYSASSSDDAVATAAVSGSDVVVNGATEGTATVTVRAEDSGGLSVAQDFDVTVSTPGPTNQSPEVVVQLPNRTIAVGLYIVTFIEAPFSDPDGDDLRFGATSSNASSVTAQITSFPWVPDFLTVKAVSVGDATVTVTATDPGGLSASLAFDVAARELPNHPPEIKATAPDMTLTVDQEVYPAPNIHDYFTEPDREYGDRLDYEAASADTTIVRTGVVGLVWYLFGVSPGMTTATVTATDRRGLTVSQTINVTVEAAGGS